MDDYNELALRYAKVDRENTELRKMLDQQIVANAALTGENAELFCKLAAAQKDAERYRWLRDVGDETWLALGKRPGVQFTHQIDAAIDAAMKEKAE